MNEHTGKRCTSNRPEPFEDYRTSPTYPAGEPAWTPEQWTDNEAAAAYVRACGDSDLIDDDVAVGRALLTLEAQRDAEAGRARYRDATIAALEAKLAEVTKERDEQQKAAPPDVAAGRVLTAEQVAQMRSSWAVGNIALCDSHEALRAERDEAHERLDAFEEAVRDNLPEVTTDSDGNLETNEICRVETVGLLFTENERALTAARTRIAELEGALRDALDKAAAAHALLKNVNGYVDEDDRDISTARKLVSEIGWDHRAALERSDTAESPSATPSIGPADLKEPTDG